MSKNGKSTKNSKGLEGVFADEGDNGRKRRSETKLTPKKKINPANATSLTGAALITDNDGGNDPSGLARNSSTASSEATIIDGGNNPSGLTGNPSQAGTANAGGTEAMLQNTLLYITSSLKDIREQVTENSANFTRLFESHSHLAAQFEQCYEDEEDFIPSHYSGASRTHEMSPDSEQEEMCEKQEQLLAEPKEKKSVKQSFLEDLTSEAIEQRGPSLGSQFSSFITRIMRTKAEETEELGKNTFPPGNCEGLFPVKVNSEVWTRIAAPARQKDLKVQVAGNLLVAGTTHLAYLIEKLTENWDQETGVVSDQAMQEVLQCGKSALKLLGGAHYEIQMRRREYLKSELNASHVHLCSSTVPFTTQLFGDDVTKTISEITSQNRATSKAMRETTTSSRGRFRGRARGWRPFRGRPQFSRTQRYSPYRTARQSDSFLVESRAKGPQFKRKTPRE